MDKSFKLKPVLYLHFNILKKILIGMNLILSWYIYVVGGH